MVIVRVPLDPPQALLALTATLKVPLTDGTPEISPLDVFKDKPAGSPAALNTVGLLVAVRVKLKATPCCPLAVVGEVSTEPAPVTVTVTARLPVPHALVADTVIVKPGQNTLPDIMPVVELTVTPAGSPVAEYDVGELVAVMV